jgi:uncharacterized protein
MNKINLLTLFAFLFSISFSFAQGIIGKWSGDLEVMGQKIPLIINLDQNGDELIGTMDSPKQGAFGIKLSKAMFDGTLLFFEINSIAASYEGIFMGDQISGTFQQGGVSLPLNFKRISNEEAPKDLKPQLPKPPFNYVVEEVSFRNDSANVNLKGTLTRPSKIGTYPAVLLVGGSGPSDRDNQVLGHQPFFVMADHLTKNGVLVLRYDERGVGKSSGDFSSATYSDLVSDVHSALNFLKDHPNVNPNQIGVIGHSEGGLIAFQVASESSLLAFMISLAGPVVAIKDLMIKQTEDVYRSSGMPKELVDKQVKLNTGVYDLFIQSNSKEEIIEGLNLLVKDFLVGEGLSGATLTKQKEDLVKAYSAAVNPWFLELIKLNPESFISAIDIPIFAAFGGKDTQVNAAQNGNHLIKLFESSPSLLKVEVYTELNHLFQTANTGSVNEYAQIEETFHTKVLEDIVKFIFR